MGGSLGKSKSSSGNAFNQSVFKPQSQALQNLWGQAMGQLQQNFMPQITGAASTAEQRMGDVYSGAKDINQQLAQGGAFGGDQDVQGRLLDMMGKPSQTGRMYESIVGGRGNEYIDPVIENLRSDAAQNVQTLQGGNALDAAMAGQSGSSRQAMENAMITNQANRDLLGQESQLRAGAYDKDLGMKMDIAKMADTNRQSEQDRLFNMLSGRQRSMESAQGGNQLMQSLAMGGMAPWMQTQQAGWNPYNNMANIIGSPTVLGSGSGSSKSKGIGSSGSLWG